MKWGYRRVVVGGYVDECGRLLLCRVGRQVQDRKDFIGDDSRFNAIEAEVVATIARSVAENRARPASERKLNDIIFGLPPTLEPAIGMSGAPDANDRDVDERCEVHISGVH